MKKLTSIMLLAISILLINLECSQFPNSNTTRNSIVFDPRNGTLEKQTSGINVSATSQIILLHLQFEDLHEQAIKSANNNPSQSHEIISNLYKQTDSMILNAATILENARRQAHGLHESHKNYQVNHCNHSNSSNSLASQQTQVPSWKDGFRGNCSPNSDASTSTYSSQQSSSSNNFSSKK